MQRLKDFDTFFCTHSSQLISTSNQRRLGLFDYDILHNIYEGKHHGHHKVTHQHVTDLYVECSDENAKVPIENDGELPGKYVFIASYVGDG